MPILGTIASSKLTAVASDFDYIDGTTLTSATQNVTFSSLTTDYTHLQIRISSRNIGGDAGLGMRFNGDTTAGNYTWQRGYNASSDYGNDSYVGQTPNSTGENANLFGVCLIDIPNYRRTDQKKTLRSFTGYVGSYKAAFMLWQTWNNTAAITSITITNQTMGGTSSMAIGTQISIYGLV
jgi:hypothetical protein